MHCRRRNPSDPRSSRIANPYPGENESTYRVRHHLNSWDSNQQSPSSRLERMGSLGYFREPKRMDVALKEDTAEEDSPIVANQE
jgi:hypothetical protein